jgi:hypothetical protein
VFGSRKNKRKSRGRERLLIDEVRRLGGVVSSLSSVPFLRGLLLSFKYPCSLPASRALLLVSLSLAPYSVMILAIAPRLTFESKENPKSEIILPLGRAIDMTKQTESIVVFCLSASVHVIPLNPVSGRYLLKE